MACGQRQLALQLWLHKQQRLIVLGGEDGIEQKMDERHGHAEHKDDQVEGAGHRQRQRQIAQHHLHAFVDRWTEVEDGIECQMRPNAQRQWNVQGDVNNPAPWRPKHLVHGLIVVQYARQSLEVIVNKHAVGGQRLQQHCGGDFEQDQGKH